MGSKRTRLISITGLIGLTACVTMIGGITMAQRKGGSQSSSQRPFVPPPGAQQQASEQIPIVAGTITGGNLRSGHLVIQSQFDNAQTIQVTDSTQIVTQLVVPASNIKVNDFVQVQGIPTGITASSLVDGQRPAFFALIDSAQRGGGSAGSNSAASDTRQGFAQAKGLVTSVNPLTIALSASVTMTVKIAPNAGITKITPLTINNLKSGDHVIAVGQINNAGVFVATGIAVNMH